MKFVANSVVTHERTLQEKPELVQRFLGALLSGWQQALDPKNEAAVLSLLQHYEPDTPQEIQLEQLQITRGLIHPDPAVAIGSIDRAGWEQTQAIMVRQKLLPQKFDLSEILKPLKSP